MGHAIQVAPIVHIEPQMPAPAIGITILGCVEQVAEPSVLVARVVVLHVAERPTPDELSLSGIKLLGKLVLAILAVIEDINESSGRSFSHCSSSGVICLITSEN
jgi:hypothetical protein